MTSGLLTEPASTDATISVDAAKPVPNRALGLDAARRRLATPGRPDPRTWIPTLAVVAIAALLRILNLAQPKGKIFDETYYATEAQSLLRHGVEWDLKQNTAAYVVHPPLGKWCIALGEWIFGYHEFGWRISAAVAGTISVLLVIRIAQRLFGSTILACTAGLLMALDGLHFVLSRSALLDIFLMAFIVAAFACLLRDRDWQRARALARLERGPSAAGPWWRAVPWWRVAAGAMMGCAGAVKWSAVWYVAAFLLLALIWDAATSRTAGSRVPWSETLVTKFGWYALFVAVAATVYLLSWSGWLLTDDGFYRHWLDSEGRAEPPVFGALQNLWHYHHEAWKFHTTLSSHHQYQSWPWQWLLLGRPVAFYWSGDGPCGADSCAAEVLLLGTPLLWWSFLPALVALTWLGISRRDWRAGTIGLGVAAGILPWFWNQLDGRTMFYFYALPSEPFLILAVVYVLGVIIGPKPDPGPNGLASRDRRFYGALVAGGYVLLVALCFAYFYPVYVGTNLPYAEWLTRMWLDSRWI